MPQFDFTTYSHQIFWFALCFIALYLASYLVILPRIRSIISARKTVVDSDKLAAQKLEKQISHLQHKAEKLQQDASENYEGKLDEISRKIAKDRDQTLTKLKQDLDEAVKKSRAELKGMLEKSETKAASTIEALVQNIKTKILS